MMTASSHDQAATTPAGIEADRAAGWIDIRWQDGHASRYPVAGLRWRCPCAACAGEWGRPGRLAGLQVLPREELQLADVRMAGGYGLTPVWASGHAAGIYSWEYLRSLCPCAACRATGE